MNKLKIHIDATSLSTSGCIHNFYRTVVGSISPENESEGGFRSVPDWSMVYGIAIHKFIDVMFKTSHFPTARQEAEKIFSMQKVPKLDFQGRPKLYLNDPKHMGIVAFNLWNEWISKESTYEILTVPQTCYWCKGIGCAKCSSGYSNVPASELTFSIPFYEDDILEIFLEGTIDNLGKFNQGYFTIRDWKTTEFWDHKKYFSQYKMSRQLRIYLLACKLMAQREPDSLLGKIGKTKMAAIIDAIFIAPKPNDTKFERSEIFQFPDSDLEAFQSTLLDFCKKFSFAVQTRNFPKEGILNGNCITPYGQCRFWSVCSNNEAIAQALLSRDFKRWAYRPLEYNS